MSRPSRIEFEGVVYHLTSRGDRREDIFEDDEDRLMLLEVLGEGLARFDASVLAWCLMSNHRSKRQDLTPRFSPSVRATFIGEKFRN